MFLKGLDTFCTAQNTNVYIYTLNLQSKDNDGRKLPLNWYLLRCYGLWEMNNKIPKNTFLLSERKIILACTIVYISYATLL